MTQDNQPQVIDVLAMQQTIAGLQNQRNAAFNDAADLFGKLQSAQMQLEAAYERIKQLQMPSEDAPAVQPEVKNEEAA